MHEIKQYPDINKYIARDEFALDHRDITKDKETFRELHQLIQDRFEYRRDKVTEKNWFNN